MNAWVQRVALICALAFALAFAASASARQAAPDTVMTGMSVPKPKPKPKHHSHGAQQAERAAADAPASAAMAHDMPMASTPANARSPDYSDGYRHGPMTGMEMRDNPGTGMLLLDRLEHVQSRDDGNATAIDGEAWYGRNFDKLWLKFEGSLGEAFRTEALWAHAVSPFWDTQLGVRHDFGAGPARSWAAFGIEGLAPYWFETGATLYLGQDGRTAARAAFKYEARFTQRLILQPSLEANFYGRDDSQRGIGSGLSDVEVGLRLRYEIRREFAPYVGVVWLQRFGRTAGFARAQGESADELQFVTGARVWF